jgi:uncharacterized membrane protein
MMDYLGTVVATFLASSVEVVEVVTIVLAVGITRSWRSTMTGVSAAFLILAALTALLGTALQRWIDISALQIVVGSLLLVFGLQWLRKAILRASGFKALNDEDEIYREETDLARHAAVRVVAGLDWFAFTVAFKGMLLEGLEVIFIVMTIGASSGQLGVSALAAAAAAVVVGTAGFMLRHPLSRVPENSLKFAVGLLLSTFGTFWVGEGIGVEWLGGDVALLWLLAGFAVAASLAVRYLNQHNPARAGAAFTATAEAEGAH